MILHTVSSSPFQTKKLEQCLKLMSQTDHLLLIEDAVIAVASINELSDMLQALDDQNRLSVLSADLKARNLSSKFGFRASYDYFVKLVVKFDSYLKW